MPAAVVAAAVRSWHSMASDVTAGPPCDAGSVVSTASARCAAVSAKQAVNRCATNCAAADSVMTSGAGAGSTLPLLVALASRTGLGLSMVVKASLPEPGSVTTLTTSSNWSAALPGDSAVAAVIGLPKGS